MRMCFDRRVLASLAVLAAAVLIVQPRWFGVALPLMLALACPLSMLLMMRGMNRGQDCVPTTSDRSAANDTDDINVLRAEVRQLRAELEARRDFPTAS